MSDTDRNPCNDPCAEAKLIDKARNGDRDAMGMLYQLYQRRLIAYLLRIQSSKGSHRDEGLAEDAAQDAWANVQKGIGQFQSGTFWAWLATIARNQLIDRRRRGLRQQPVGGEVQEAMEQRPLDRTPDPGESIELQDSLRLLAQRDRDLLVLFYFESYTLKEIGAKLGIPSGTVGRQLSEARERLRQLLVR